MHSRLRGIWSGKRVLVDGCDKMLTRWTGAMLRALDAEVFLPQGDAGDWSVEALREALQIHRPDVWICTAPPQADTPALLQKALALLTDSLAAARDCGVRCALLFLGDSAYLNDDAPWGRRESDLLGGQDAGGCAQSCLRLCAEGFRRGFWGEPMAVVIAHHGPLSCGEASEVQGWLRALRRGESIALEQPDRPIAIQHALEPIAGALLAVGKALDLPLHKGDTWNFGASAQNWRTPRTVCATLAQILGAKAVLEIKRAAKASGKSPTRLESEKARTLLGWRTVYDVDDTLRLLAAWDLDAAAHDVDSACAKQVQTYLQEIERAKD